jgi:hypothetical protein
VSKVVKGIGRIGGSILGLASLIPGPQQPFLAAGSIGLSLLGGIGGSGKKGNQQLETLQFIAQLLKQPPSMSQTVRGGTAPRILAFGRVPSGGVSFLRENTPSKAIYIEGIYLCEGPFDGLDAMICDDEYVPLTNLIFGVPFNFYWPSSGSKSSGGFTLGGFIVIEPVNGSPDGKSSDLLKDGGYITTDHEAAWGPFWDATHLGKGCSVVYTAAYKAPTAADRLNIYPNGFPTYQFIFRGARVYDPRDPGQYFSQDAFDIYQPDTSWKWSENPALCAAYYVSYLISQRLMPVRGVNWDAIKEAADDCDRLVSTRRNGFNNGVLSYEPFARVSANITLDMEPRDVLAKFMECCDGSWGIDEQGRFTMWVRKWEEPSVIFDGADISDFVEEFGPSSNDVVNYAHTHYIEPRQNFQRVEAPLYRDVKSEAEVGRRTGAFAYDWVTSAGQAYRLTARRIKRENGRRRVTCVLGPRALLALKQRVIGLNAPEYGLVGTFRVEGFAPADAALASWQADLVEISEDAYTDEVAPNDPVNGLLIVNQPSVGTPTSLLASAISTGSGVGVAQLSLDINKNYPDLSNPQITVAAVMTDPTLQIDGRYSTDGGTTWANFDVLISQLIMQTPEMASGTTVTMQARFVSAGGSVGSYSSSATAVIP